MSVKKSEYLFDLSLKYICTNLTFLSKVIENGWGSHYEINVFLQNMLILFTRGVINSEHHCLRVDNLGVNTHFLLVSMLKMAINVD